MNFNFKNDDICVENAEKLKKRESFMAKHVGESISRSISRSRSNSRPRSASTVITPQRFIARDRFLSTREVTPTDFARVVDTSERQRLDIVPVAERLEREGRLLAAKEDYASACCLISGVPREISELRQIFAGLEPVNAWNILHALDNQEFQTFLVQVAKEFDDRSVDFVVYDQFLENVLRALLHSETLVPMLETMVNSRNLETKEAAYTILQEGVKSLAVSNKWIEVLIGLCAMREEYLGSTEFMLKGHLLRSDVAPVDQKARVKFYTEIMENEGAFFVERLRAMVCLNQLEKRASVTKFLRRGDKGGGLLVQLEDLATQESPHPFLDFHNLYILVTLFGESIDLYKNPLGEALVAAAERLNGGIRFVDEVARDKRILLAIREHAGNTLVARYEADSDWEAIKNIALNDDYPSSTRESAGKLAIAYYDSSNEWENLWEIAICYPNAEASIKALVQNGHSLTDDGILEIIKSSIPKYGYSLTDIKSAAIGILAERNCEALEGVLEEINFQAIRSLFNRGTLPINPEFETVGNKICECLAEYYSRQKDWVNFLRIMGLSYFTADITKETLCKLIPKLEDEDIDALGQKIESELGSEIHEFFRDNVILSLIEHYKNDPNEHLLELMNLVISLNNAKKEPNQLLMETIERLTGTDAEIQALEWFIKQNIFHPFQQIASPSDEDCVISAIHRLMDILIDKKDLGKLRDLSIGKGFEKTTHWFTYIKKEGKSRLNSLLQNKEH